MNTAATELDRKLETLRAAFAARAATEAQELTRLAAALDGGQAAEARETIRSIAHRMAGSAGLFGYSALTDPAVAVDNCILDEASNTVLRERVTALTSAIHESVPNSPSAEHSNRPRKPEVD